MQQGPNRSSLAQAADLHKAGKLKKAERIYRDILRRQPKHVPALHLLAMLHRDQQKPRRAAELLTRAVKIDDERPEVWGDLGLALGAVGRIDQGIEALERAIALAPERPELYFHLGRLNMGRSTMDQAVAALKRAVALAPERVDHLAMLALANNNLGQIPVDTTFAEQLVKLDSASPRALTTLASAHQLNNELDEAERLYRRALTSDAAFPGAIAGLANLLESRGDSEAAYALLHPLIEAGNPTFMMATTFSRVCRRLDRRGEAIPVLRGAVARKDLTPAHRSRLHSTLGKVLEETGEFAKAFESFREANQIYAGRWKKAAHLQTINDIIEAFPADRFAAMARSNNTSQRPVFIVGMYRSGSTLVETILASHPQVYGAGELTTMPRIAQGVHEVVGGELPFPHCLRELTAETADQFADEYLQALAALDESAARVTDKMLLNYMVLGFVNLLLPKARVIHCRRSPIDTCLSCYANEFTSAHAYTSDFKDLALVYAQYLRLMEHWKTMIDLPLMEVHYEELVADQEGQTRRLLEFCELPWDEACLRFHESGRVAQTLSVDQVRQGMYSSSVDRAARFGGNLGALESALRNALAPFGLEP